MQLSQRQSVLGILGFGTAIVFFVLILRLATSATMVEVAIAGAALLAFCALFFVYWRGWEPARYLLVVVITALIIVAPREADENLHAGALMAPILALVVASPTWVVGSGITIYLGALAQGVVVYRDPVNILTYTLAIAGLVASRLVVETVARTAEQNAQRAIENERRAEQEAQLSLRRAEELALQNEEQRRLLDLVAELEIPAIALADQVLFAPVVGHLDSRRAQALMSRLLDAASRNRTQMLILDITGVTAVDTQVAQALMQATMALRLLGCQVSITGISPAVASTLTTLGITFANIATARTPQEALAQYSSQQPVA